MNLDWVISAANWLYAHSPASLVAGERRSILVCGDEEMADALFELLFATAFKPGMQIELIRVCSDAAEREAAFLDRNFDGLQHFTNNAGYYEGNAARPLAIRFLDREEGGWRTLPCACAYLPDGVDFAGEAAQLFRLSEIPLLRSERGWGPGDEARVPVLRVARRVHAAYTAGWNERYREEDIDRDLYGDSGSEYMLRSSLRLAVSIPWKLDIAGAVDSEELLRKLGPGGAKIEGRPLRDYLAWQEHRSWQAFMTLEGWRMPSEEEMREYLYRDGNDHRDKRAKLHPCLCDLEDDWFDAHPRKLEKLVPSEWSGELGAWDQYSKMDRMSLMLHHRCKEIVLSPEYGERMRARFVALEDALLSNCAPQCVDVHFQRLLLIEKMFDRLQKNESNSYWPFTRACDRFAQELRRDAESIGAEALERIQAAHGAMRKEALAASERNEYSDYRKIDAEIIDWLPWIIDEGGVDTVWKLYDAGNPLMNVAAAIILRPRRLVLVHDGKIPEAQVEIYREVLALRGLNRCELSELPLKELEGGALPIAADEAQRCAVDVSGASSLQNRVTFPPEARVVYFERGKLYDKAGAPLCAGLYRRRLSMSVDEGLRLGGEINLSMEEYNEMLGMEEDCDALWDAHKALKIGGRWRALIQDGLSAAEQKLRQPVYRKSGFGESQPARWRVTEEEYACLIRNGSLRTLFDLQRLGGVSELAVVKEGAGRVVSMNLFPEPGAIEDPFGPSRRTIGGMFSKIAEESRFVVDDDYVSVIGPLQICDLSRPLRLQEVQMEAGERRRVKDALGALIRQGLIREEGGGYVYKSAAVRHGLRKEGFALEALVYYTLFLSGRFDDVRSNVRIKTGMASDTAALEKELDVLVSVGGCMGLISCKDTARIEPKHIMELVMQAREYGVNARPILVCTENERLDSSVVDACELLQITRIGPDALRVSEASKRKLVGQVLNAIWKK